MDIPNMITVLNALIADTDCDDVIERLENLKSDFVGLQRFHNEEFIPPNEEELEAGKIKGISMYRMRTGYPFRQAIKVMEQCLEERESSNENCVNSG